MDNQKKIAVRAWLAAVCFGAASLAVPVPMIHAEDSVLELQAQYEKLERQIKENQAKLDAKKQDASEQKEVVSEIESEIGALNSQITILNKKIDLLNSEIGTLNEDIDSLDQEIFAMETQIAQTKEDIERSQKQVDSTYKKALDRLAKSYMAGSASDLELLLGAKSMTDVLTWQQYIQNASEYDRGIIQNLESNIQQLEDLQNGLDNAVVEVAAKKEQAQAQKADLETKQADVQVSADDLNTKKNTANAKRNQAYSLLKSMNSESEEYKKLDAQMRAEEERIDAEMNARLAKIASVQAEPAPETTTAAAPSTTAKDPSAIGNRANEMLSSLLNAATSSADAENASANENDPAVPSPGNLFGESGSTASTTAAESTTAAGGSQKASTGSGSSKNRGLICPIQNPHAVVSGTYPYYASGGVHHGIDIVVTDTGKTMGHAIVAPQSGKVITVGYGDASCGNYIEIDHGDGLVTRYYHCSAILVALGQTVSQGQTIGKVGDTGNTTGPHLHFEVLLNTTSGLIRQNPLSYISVP